MKVWGVDEEPAALSKSLLWGRRERKRREEEKIYTEARNEMRKRQRR